MSPGRRLRPGLTRRLAVLTRRPGHRHRAPRRPRRLRAGRAPLPPVLIRPRPPTPEHAVAACSQLVRDMATGLIELIHPHGRVDAGTTVKESVRAIRLFATAMAERGHVGGAAQLTRPALIEQLGVTGHSHESMIRRILAAFDQGTQALRPEVRELVGGRAYNPQRRRGSKPLLPYDETVWRRLQEVCRAEIQEAWAQFQQARAAAEQVRDPYQHGWSYENLCWWMLRHGPENAVSLGQRAGWTPTMVYYRMGRGGEVQRALGRYSPPRPW